MVLLTSKTTIIIMNIATLPSSVGRYRKLVAPLGAMALSIGISHAAATADASSAAATTAAPAPAASDADALAKKLANPIAAMISVPFQNNFDWGSGPGGDGFQYKLNFQVL